MSQLNIDVLICVDCRLSFKDARRLEKHTKITLGPFARVHFASCDTMPSPRKKRRSAISIRVGGLFCIINSRWGPSLLSCKDDDTGLGLLTCLPLRTADGTISIMGSYWPNKHSDSSAMSHPDSLWSHTQSWLHRYGKPNVSPISYVQDLSAKWISSAFKDLGHAAIYGGDLNATWASNEPGGCYTLHKWAEDTQLINGPLQIAQHRGERFLTHQSGSWIDHILHAGPLGHIDILDSYYANGPEWAGISDHRPIVGIYRVSPPSTRPPVLAIPPQPRNELDRNDPRALDAFDLAMRSYIESHPYNTDTVEEASSYLYHLECFSARLVSRINRTFGIKVPRSNFKDGWSPHFAALKIHLQTILEIKRHITGQQCRCQWTNYNTLKDW